jgi:hypothetical protein
MSEIQSEKLKVVQIATTSPCEDECGSLFALRSDGKIFRRFLVMSAQEWIEVEKVPGT